jgi:hypothetical protein
VQIMAHSARTFSRPRNRNWRKPRACLICPKHRFHHLLSQAVGCFEAAVGDFFSHPLGQRSADFSVRGCRVLGASGRDVAVDAVGFERCEIGFAAVAGVR